MSPSKCEEGFVASEASLDSSSVTNTQLHRMRLIQHNYQNKLSQSIRGHFVEK